MQLPSIKSLLWFHHQKGSCVSLVNCHLDVAVISQARCSRKLPLSPSFSSHSLNSWFDPTHLHVSIAFHLWLTGRCDFLKYHALPIYLFLFVDSLNRFTTVTDKPTHINILQYTKAFSSWSCVLPNLHEGLFCFSVLVWLWVSPEMATISETCFAPLICSPFCLHAGTWHFSSSRWSQTMRYC